MTYTYGNTSHKHAVNALSNGNSYAYDANGNMTTREVGGQTFNLIYNGENRLVTVSEETTPPPLPLPRRRMPQRGPELLTRQLAQDCVLQEIVAGQRQAFPGAQQRLVGKGAEGGGAELVRVR